MCGIKIPQQDFALKILEGGGGLMREGGVFAGHYGILLDNSKSTMYLHLHVESYALSKLCFEQAMIHTGKTNVFTAMLKAITVTAT